MSRGIVVVLHHGVGPAERELAARVGRIELGCIARVYKRLLLALAAAERAGIEEMHRCVERGKTGMGWRERRCVGDDLSQQIFDFMPSVRGPTRETNLRPEPAVIGLEVAA